MYNDLTKWYNGISEKFISDLGISRDEIVLDFGCGEGAYTIPAAKAVGAKGLVHAVDMNDTVLTKIKNAGRQYNLENINVINTNGEYQIPLADEAVDSVILFDVLNPFYFNSAAVKIILEELFRITKPCSKVYLYPRHTNVRKLLKQMNEAGFIVNGSTLKILMHNHKLEKDNIYIINKR